MTIFRPVTGFVHDVFSMIVTYAFNVDVRPEKIPIFGKMVKWSFR